jgi:hypothetical protein
MKKQINDLLLKMQTGENCIGETANHLLNLFGVGSSFNIEVKDRDIVTIEALHDTLLDEKALGLNARSMKDSRALTQRMYKAIIKD